MRRIDIIINPISGTHSKSLIPALASEVFPNDRFDVRLHTTVYSGQAAKIVKEAIYMGTDTIVAAGGDGTVNEIAGLLVDANRPNIKFGVLPLGSGNGLALHAEIPLDIREALEVIRDGHSELIDYGDLNGHKFFTTAGTGFDAEVGQRFSEMGTRGPITYGRAIVEKGTLYKPKHYTLYTDKEVISDDLFMITVGNAAQWGNNFFVAPRASQQDGLFSVSVVKPFLVLEAPLVIYQMMNRQFDQNEHVRTIDTRSLRIESDDIGYCHVDGEPMLLPSPLVFTMHANGLRLIVPLVREHKL